MSCSATQLKPYVGRTACKGCIWTMSASLGAEWFTPPTCSHHTTESAGEFSLHLSPRASARLTNIMHGSCSASTLCCLDCAQYMYNMFSPDDRECWWVWLALVIKGHLTTQQLICHDANCPDIRSRVYLAAHDLRSHEPETAIIQALYAEYCNANLSRPCQNHRLSFATPRTIAQSVQDFCVQEVLMPD